MSLLCYYYVINYDINYDIQRILLNMYRITVSIPER